MVKVINPGEFNNKISVLALKQIENTFLWEQTSSPWAKTEQLSSNNLFSRIGLGAKSIKFTMRKRKDLSLHNAFRWKGKHCFLTDIVEIDRMYYEVTAALIEPRSCSVRRTGKPGLNDLNRPVYGDSETLVFPACLTEKYMGYTQEAPMAIQETRYVLITPKSINLITGELVVIDEIPYTVVIPHTLDEYKNEYEIIAKGDV